MKKTFSLLLAIAMCLSFVAQASYVEASSRKGRKIETKSQKNTVINRWQTADRGKTEADNKKTSSSNKRGTSPVWEPAPVVPDEQAPVVSDEQAPVIPDEQAPVVPDEPAPVVPDEPAPAIPDEPAPAIPDEPAPAILPEQVPVILPEQVPIILPEQVPIIPEQQKPSAMEQGVDVTTLGAKGDGKTDDTSSIQNALNKHDKVYIPSGTYMINAEKALKPKSNQTITLDSGAVLKAISSNKSYTAVIRVEYATDVVITGGTIIGERYSHVGNTGEWGMGISVDTGAFDVRISDIIIKDCWGDGIYIGGNTPVSDIVVDGVICDNNRRQGLSITNATHVTIRNSIFRNTNGTLPQSGIDIEPNPGNTTTDITIINTQCYGNMGSGLDLMGLNEKIKRITVSACAFNDNVKAGIQIVNANELSFSDTQTINNYIGIEIPRDVSTAKFINMEIGENQDRGVSLAVTSQDEGTQNILFENSKIFNNSQKKANDVDGVRVDADSSGYVRNITFNNCDIYDDQKSKTQRYGLTVGFSNKLSAVTVNEFCTFSGNILGSLFGGDSLVYNL